MFTSTLPQLPLILHNSCKSVDDSFTCLTINCHHPVTEHNNKMAIVNTAIEAMKCFIKNDTVTYDDVISLTKLGHESGDLSLTGLYLDDSLTSKVNEILANMVYNPSRVTIDSFIEDFKDIYTMNVPDKFKETIKNMLDILTDYLSLYKYVNWDKTKDLMLMNIETKNPITGEVIYTFPLTEVVVGTFIKGFGFENKIKSLLYTKQVGGILVEYFDNLRKRNPDIDKTKRIDIFSYDHKTDVLRRHQCYTAGNKYYIKEVMSY